MSKITIIMKLLSMITKYTYKYMFINILIVVGQIPGFKEFRISVIPGLVTPLYPGELNIEGTCGTAAAVHVCLALGVVTKGAMAWDRP